MASFSDPNARPGSRGVGGTSKTAIEAVAGTGAANASPANSAELEKLKSRVAEVEKILMTQGLTMKNLGEDSEDANTRQVGKKSTGKFDKDWTAKVEHKLSKLNTAFKTLTNKVSDLSTA